MKEAFNFMFKDNMFVKKALTYSAVVFVATLCSNIANTLAPQANTLPSLQFILLSIIGFILMFIPSGYGVSCIKAFIEQNENIIIPFVNIKNNFILGLKLTISIILVTLLFGIVIAIVAIILALIFSLLNAISIGAIILGLLILGLILTYTYYSLAFCYIFATTEKFTSFLQFKTATNLIKINLKHYTLSVLLFVVLSLVVGVIGMIMLSLLAIFGLIGITIATLFAALISGYTVYLFTYLNSKSIKNT